MGGSHGCRQTTQKNIKHSRSWQVRKGEIIGSGSNIARAPVEISEFGSTRLGWAVEDRVVDHAHACRCSYASIKNTQRRQHTAAFVSRARGTPASGLREVYTEGKQRTTLQNSPRPKRPHSPTDKPLAQAVQTSAVRSFLFMHPSFGHPWAKQYLLRGAYHITPQQRHRLSE